MNRTSTKWLRCVETVAVVVLWLAAGAAQVYATQGVEVVRRVDKDEFVMPSRSGSDAPCAAGTSSPDTGDEIRLTVVPGKARRDESGLSYIVDLGAKKAYLLHHSNSSYSEFKYPPKAVQLETSFDSSLRTGLGAEADDFLSFRNEVEVEESRLEVAGHQAVERFSTINNGMNHRRDVGAEIMLHPDLGDAAQAVEAFAEAVRSSGRAWLPLLGEAVGVPLSLTTARHQPEVKIRYAEKFVSLSEGEFGSELFAKPGDYRKVAHRPECY